MPGKAALFPRGVALSELGGGKLIVFSEGKDEIAGSGEACFQGDLGDGSVVAYQQLRRPAETDGIDVGGEGQAGSLCEKAGKAGSAHVQRPGGLAHADGLA